MIGEFDDLRQTRIYSSLESRINGIRDPLAQQYTGQISSAFTTLHQYLNEIRRYFHQFTDHSITHSIRIISRIGSFLDDVQISRLTTTELYFLISCPLMHDIGMVVGESEVDAILENPQFKEESQAFCIHNSIQNCDDWERRGIGRMFLTDYIRRHHGERAKNALLTDVLPVKLLTGGDDAVASWIGKICEAHTRPFTDIADDRIFPDRLLLHDRRLNTRFIAICLRLGDLLDINTDRICPALRMLSEPLHFISKSHWDQYSKIEVLETTPGKDIVIAGRCPTQESHRVLKQWIGWLKEESANAVQLLSMSDRTNAHYRLALGPVKDAVEPDCDDDGQPLYEFLEYKFNLDEERVFKRLFGKELYGRVDVAFRELLQNAIDATRIRVAVECSRTSSWQKADAEGKQQLYRNAYNTRRLDLGLILQVSEDTDVATGEIRQWLHVVDQGVGMSRDVIRDYLLKVGRTRWREDIRVRDLPIGTIGEFGIGFLSTFMISDRTVIRTQSCLPDEEGIEATIFTWDGYLATKPTTESSVGTCVSLRLMREVCDQAANLEELALRWCPFVELPITLVYKDGSSTYIEPRRLGACPGRDKSTVVSMQDGESTVAIESVSVVRGEGAQASVSQDGIVIPEMLPPVLEIPEQQILRWRGVCVNLLGESRCGLHLSRGLLEGGQERFWSECSRKIWAALAINGLKHKPCRSALSEYVLAEHVRTKGLSLFIVGPGSSFRKQLSNQGVPSESLCFGELDNNSLGNWCPDAASATCLIPNFADMLIDEQLTMSTAWALEESYLSDEEEYEHDRDSADFLNDHSNAIHADTLDSKNIGEAINDRISIFAKEQKGLAEFWANKLSEVEFPAATAFTGTAARLINQYRYLRSNGDGRSVLSKVSGTALEKVGAFRMSESWWALRHIATGAWTAAFTPEITFGIDAKQMDGLDECDYLLYVLCRVWSPVRTTEWGMGWPNQLDMVNLGKKLDKILSEGEDINPYEPPYYDENLLDEWYENYKEASESELREWRDEWERDNFTTVFFREVAGRKLSAILTSACRR